MARDIFMRMARCELMRFIRCTVLLGLAAGLLLGVTPARSDTVVKTIPVGTLPTQAQLTPDSSKLYVSNEGAPGACPLPPSTVSVISTASDSVIATVPVGVDPGPIRFTPDGTKAYVVNESPCDASGSVSVIAVSSSNVLNTVPVGRLPVTLTASKDGAKVYVTNKGASSNSVSVICTGLVLSVCSATDTVIKTILLDNTVGIQPHVIAKNRSGSEVWVAEQDCPAVLGCTTGNVAVICTGYLVTAICNSTNTDTVVANVTLGPTPGSIHFAPDGTRAYVASRGNGAQSIAPTVAHVNATTHAVVNTIPITPPGFPLDAAPHAMRITPDGAKVYVANRHAADVAVICTGAAPGVCSTSDSVLAYVPVGASPARVELTPSGGRLYVTNEGSNTVSIISTAVDSEVGAVAVGSAPVDLEITDDGAKAYVTNASSNEVSVIAIDSDGDGYPDSIESHVGTSPFLFCSADTMANNEHPDARPTDLNDDRSVTGADLSLIAGEIGVSVPPASVRKDIAPDPAGDNAITGADLSRVAGIIGTAC